MLKLRPLHPLLQKKAIEEVNEDPERIKKDLDAFKDWIKKSSHIKSRVDDQFLVNFLRGCKYSLEKVKQKFDLYHTLKTHAPEITKNRDPSNEIVLGALRQGYYIPLPLLESPDGPKYYIIRLGACDFAKYNIEDTTKVTCMIIDLFMYRDDNLSISGSIGVIDLTGVNISFLLQFTPSIIKKIIMLTQESIPVRQKAIYIFNMPASVIPLFNLAVSLTSEKIKQRIYVLGSDMDALYKAIPRKLLPKEYGGDAGTIQDTLDDLEKNLVENTEFFIEDEMYGVDERKRIGRAKNTESLFGLDGNFRQLKID